MTQESQKYIQRLRNLYNSYSDNESLLALVEIEELDERARELQIYREQPKTQEIIHKALERYKNCLEKLTNPTIAMEMTDKERAYCFAAMDWATFTLDAVGEDPSKITKEVDKMVLSYAQKAGVAYSLTPIY